MRIPINRDRPVPLYRQIEQFLREQIHTGALPPQAGETGRNERYASVE